MTVEIHLEAECVAHECREFATRTFDQLHEDYTEQASVMRMPSDVKAHLGVHRTLRKRAHRAARRYQFHEIRRSDFEEDIFQINTSAPQRQGRPMTAGYLTRPAFLDRRKWCDRHHVYPYGVLDRDRLVAYLWLYRVGELAMVSSILGHADHLANEVMYLLMAGMLREQAPLGGIGFYNRHGSGTDGLRFFKERVGFEPANVEWVLQ